MKSLVLIFAFFLSEFQLISQDKAPIIYCEPLDSVEITNKLIKAKQAYKMHLYDSVVSLSEGIVVESKSYNYQRGVGEGYFLKARGLARLGRREKAIEMYQLAVEQFLVINDHDRMASTYNNWGILLRAEGNFRDAINIGEQALLHVNGSKNRLLNFNILNNLGNSYQRLALFKKATDSYFGALKLVQYESDSLSRVGMRAEVYINLGLIYLKQKLIPKTLETLHEARRILETQSMKPQLATVYFNLGFTYTENMEYKLAKHYLKLAHELYSGLQDEIGMALCKRTNGRILFAKKFYNQATMEQNAAVKKLEKLNAFIYLPYSYLVLGDTYLAAGDPKRAEFALLKGLQIALGAGQRLEELKIYEGLIELHKSQNELQLALLYYDIYSALSQELNDQQIGRHIGQLELKELLDRRDQALKLLESETATLHFRISRKNSLLTLSLSLFLVSSLLFLIVLRQHKLKAKHKGLMLEQKMLRAQLNPHFIFNVLGAIQHYFGLSAPDKAANYLSKFSKLMRSVLNGSRSSSSLLGEELDTLRDYLDLQALRFTGPFNYEIFVEDGLNLDSTEIPSMIIQPLVENAVEHGLMPQNHGKVELSVYKTKGGIKIIVEDNGVGINKPLNKSLKKKSYPGLGITITQERLALLNKGRVRNIELNLENRSSRDPSFKGTRAELEIPLNLK